MKFRNFRKIEKAIYLLLALSFVLGMPHIVAGNTFFYLSIQASMDISSPLTVLQNITNSFIYTNNTSAKVTVSNITENLDVLQIINKTNDNWQLQLIAYDDTNITRLTNCTIWFHNENTTSVQIKIVDGAYNQFSGGWYAFTMSTNITITVTTNATGTSLVHTYLKILKPGTSTYWLYTITFEIAD